MMSGNSLHKDQGGRISIFFVFGAVAFIFLIALIYNTASQSIRKIQMQGAADAAAIAGGAHAASELNEIADNNNMMSEILTAMIVIRSMLQTVEAMKGEINVAAGVAAIFGQVEVAAPLYELGRAFDLAATIIGVIDSAVSDPSNGAGWEAMKSLDDNNVSIKTTFPAWAEEETRNFAKNNGADRGLYGVLIPRESPALDLVPFLPVARGRELELLDRAEATYLKPLQPIPGPLLLVFLFVQPSNPGLIYLSAVKYNTSNLRGNKITSAISKLAGVISNVPGLETTEPLDWPDEPPKPMLLTDQPSLDPAAAMDANESAADLSKVRKHLQYLAVATGKMSRGSRVGGEKFLNVAPYQSLAYAQADVYNPTRWSLFEQNWRVKLAPAVTLNEKFNQVTGIMGLNGASQFVNGRSFVNNH